MPYVNEAGETKTVELINQIYWCQNEFQVTQQVTMKGSYRNRYDVTLLINGLPLVQIELKRRGLELKEAFNQTNRLINLLRNLYTSAQIVPCIWYSTVSPGFSVATLPFSPMKYSRASSPFWPTVGLAALAGARTMAAPALLSRHLSQYPSRRLKRTRLATLQSPRTARVLSVLEAGEMIGDKLPMTPARIRTAALIGRGVSGALVGAALYARRRRSPARGGVLGALSALAGAYATYYGRKQLAENTLLPDPVWGGVEDLLVVKAGRRLLSGSLGR